MTILETAILLERNSLCEAHFYSSKNILSDKDRKFLRKTISVLVKSAFDEKIHKFSMDEHKILIKLKNLRVTDEDTKEKTNNQLLEHPKKLLLVIYCIAEKNTEQKLVNECMDEAITQFLDQFSIFDIKNKKTKDFKKFNKQLKSIFQELALKPEDRFKNLLY